MSIIVGDDEPPPRPLREVPRLLRAGVGIVWRAARAELVVQLALQLLGGVVALATVLVGARVLRELFDVAGDRADLVDALPSVAALTALVALGGLASNLAQERQLLVAELVSRRQQDRLMRTAGAVELAEFERPEFHDALARAQRSAMNGPVQLVTGLGGVGAGLSGLAGALVALLALDPLLVPLAVVSVVPTVVLGARGREDVYRFAYRFTGRDRERVYLGSVLTDRSAAAEVRAYTLADHVRERWWSLSSARLAELRRMVLRQHVLSALGALCRLLAVGGVLVALFALIDAGDIDGADATAAGGALLLLGQRLLSTAGETGRLYEALLYVHDVLVFEARDAIERPRGGAAPAPAPVVARDVVFRYPSGTRPALDTVNVRVEPGELVALVGENGSGKTTLAKLLAGLHTPQSGSVRWGERDLRDCDADAVRSQVAMIMQDHQRWLLSAHDNVGLGRHERLDDESGVRRAAAQAGIDSVLASLPAGYASVLGPQFGGGTEISGGQWQRVALARALFRDATFVVLDEPTAALDARAEHDLFRRLRALLEGRAGLVVSHRVSTVRDADRIYVLHEGRVEEQGDHASLMARGGRYAELFALQASAYR